MQKHTEPHLTAGDTIWVSGEVPRVTDFEEGLKGSMRLVEGEWISEEVSLVMASLGGYSRGIAYYG